MDYGLFTLFTEDLIFMDGYTFMELSRTFSVTGTSFVNPV